MSIDLRATLYDMTKAMMKAMNVEFEYQIRNRLHDWLVSGKATVPPVQQQPLDANGQPVTPPPGTTSPPPPGMAAPPPPAPMAPPNRPPPPPMPSGGSSLPPPVPMPPPGNP